MATPRLRTRTSVVAGPIALHTRRLQAARQGTLGLQVVTMEQLAAHLAGGLLRPASTEELDVAVRSALEAGGYGELQELATFPGAVRAALRTLGRLWEADLPLSEMARGSQRMADLALLDVRTREALPPGSLALPDLAHAAASRAHLAARLCGPVEFACLPYLAPAWRGLVDALARHVPLRWSGPLPLGVDGRLPGERTPEQGAGALPQAAVVACADPRSEALEALRWVRGLLASGQAGPGDIAVAAADPRAWDEAMLAARAHCGLPLHFSHGIPALETRQGQACAALADLLQHGLSQERVRRVLAHCAAAAPGLASLASHPLLGIAPHAGLSELEHWRTALAAALPARADGGDPAPALLPLLEAAAKGLSAAPEAGRLFLPPAAQRLWADALRRAPCHALPITLEALRSADARHPGDSATWGPAGHLAGAPRPFVWLLGLNVRAWPRQSSDDPLLPAHVLDPSRLGLPTAAALDRAAFAAIRNAATGALTLSRARRNRHGNILSPSPLLSASGPERTLARHRIPRHACSPADRLLARPAEAALDRPTAAATACANGRRSSLANPYDGLLPANHALIAKALDQVQSPTSLRLLLRNPQGFVWRRALHWSSPPRAASQLTLDPRAHGELVHEMLRDAVDALEAGPGYGHASDLQVREAVDAAARSALQSWPPRRPTPPRLLWAHAVDVAACQAIRALERDGPLQSTTRSYTEVPFGGQRTAGGRRLPWDPGQPVAIPGSALRFGGVIDRLDVRADGAVQVTDYKTGAVPERHVGMTLDGGRELQRVLYALAARTLLPDAGRIIRARLVFLRAQPALVSALPQADLAIADACRCLAFAAASLLLGVSLPGPDADEQWADGRLALPAAGAAHSAAKRRAFNEALGEAAQIWSKR